MPRAAFEAFNQRARERGERTLANPRNAAAAVSYTHLTLPTIHSV